MSVTPPEPPPARQSSNGWALTGMILGIAIWTIGWALFWFPPAQLAIVVVGIVASALGLRNSGRVDEEGRVVCQGRGFAIAGLVMNSIAAPGILIWTLLVIIGMASGS